MKLYELLKTLFQKIFADGELFYIGTSRSLPPPLSAEEEEDVISRLDTEPALRKTLVERNLRLVVYIAKKFENTGVNIEDLISIGTIGLIKACNTYKPDKNIKLATYASRCIENEILMYIRKNSQSRCEISLDEPLHVDRDGNELLVADTVTVEGESVSDNIEAKEEKEIVRRLVATLPPRERQIIELRFGLNGEEELTQKQAAKKLGISQSYISRLEKKIIQDLKERIEQLI